MLRRFEALREELLRAGLAPRRVNRYLRELRDHFDDLVNEQIERGVLRESAETEASRRMGSDEELASFMLEQPEMRSFTARFPFLVFGFGPLIMLALVLLSATLIEGGFLTLQFAMAEQWSGGTSARPDWAKFLVEGWNWLVMYVAPIAIAAALYLIGMRQRMPAHWIMFGLTVIAFVGAFHDIGIRWSDLPGQTELSVGLALYPPFAYDIERVAINAATIAALYWTMTRWRPVPTN